MTGKGGNLKHKKFFNWDASFLYWLYFSSKLEVGRTGKDDGRISNLIPVVSIDGDLASAISCLCKMVQSRLNVNSVQDREAIHFELQLKLLTFPLFLIQILRYTVYNISMNPSFLVKFFFFFFSGSIWATDKSNTNFHIFIAKAFRWADQTPTNSTADIR